jgi:alpha,alpha-trehalase
MSSKNSTSSDVRLYYNNKTVGKNGEIYCHGRLLDTVQMSRIFADSKHFVDMKLKVSPDETLKIFDDFMHKHNNAPTQDQIANWVNANFDPPGSEFEKWIPSDFKKNPKILDLIKDKDYRQFASDLNEIWLQLGRKMKKEVAENNELYSIIYVENGVIVPGGRFREFYYWDSYWIILGLLHSEMFATTKGMLENFLSIVDRYGFIPNGGRIYYSMRSQPPLLTSMVDVYVDATKDYDFAKRAVSVLENEFNYWITKHTVTVNGFVVARYDDRSIGPRPESFREDIETASHFKTEDAKNEHYSELKAAAESGMDFSSRWFINQEKGGSNDGDLTHLQTRSIIPVELNAILFHNAKVIAKYFKMFGNNDKAAIFEEHADNFLRAVNELLWNEEAGAWFDYDMINNRQRPYFVVSNLLPLWTQCYNQNKSAHITEKVLKYIQNEELDSYPGGVPNTKLHTGEQWDYPNVWPPMQHALIVGLKNLEDDRAKNLAKKWADRWVQGNYLAYKERKAMYEKYLANELGGHGGGGEYEIQTGFGWTNGVVLDLLAMYGDAFKPLPSGSN